MSEQFSEMFILQCTSRGFYDEFFIMMLK